MSTPSLQDKLHAYLDFLRLHQEARKDKVIVRDRKMLNDGVYSDSRKGYTPTINRLFRDCLTKLFSTPEYGVEKMRDSQHTYFIKPKTEQAKSKVHKVMKNVALKKINEEFVDNLEDVNNLLMLLSTEVRNHGEQARNITLEMNRAGPSFTNFLRIDGQQNQQPKTYETYKNLKKAKDCIETIVQHDDNREINYGNYLSHIINKMNVADQRNHEETVAADIDTAEPTNAILDLIRPMLEQAAGEVTITPAVDTDLETRRRELYNGIPEGDRPDINIQLRHARLMLERERQ